MKKISAIAIAILLSVSASSWALQTTAKTDETTSHHCTMAGKESAAGDPCCCCCCMQMKHEDHPREGAGCPMDKAKAGCCAHSEHAEQKTEATKPQN